MVLPAYNQGGSIGENLTRIRERIESLGVSYELIIVSDGSRDNTLEAARAAAPGATRVLGYGRNQGKGFAVRTGSQAARGRWVAWVDSDLDLDPASLATFLDRAEQDGLDAVIGSKRHPDSKVEYPAHRRVYSWLYQQLVRVMFGLRVRDTQVGLKLFRREALQRVLPLVLVKRYAFDLEVLALLHHLGYERIEEAPVVLEYQFAGSGINWRSIAHALWDTAAVFYRMRIGFYDRRVAVARIPAALRPPARSRRLDVLVLGKSSDPCLMQTILAAVGPRVEVGSIFTEGAGGLGNEEHRELVRCSDSDVVALLSSEAVPGGDWAEAALALFDDPLVDAVVGPTMAVVGGPVREHAAAVLGESRLAVGGARIRHHAGRLRPVDDYPVGNLFVRTEVLRGIVNAGVPIDDDLCRVLSLREGRTVLCSPDVIATARPRPLIRRHLGHVWRLGASRGRRLSAGAHPRARHLVPSLFAVFVAVGPFALRSNGLVEAVWLTLGGAYVVALLGFGMIVQIMHRRVAVTAASMAGVPASHLAFGFGYLWGTFSGAYGWMTGRPPRDVGAGDRWALGAGNRIDDGGT